MLYIRLTGARKALVAGISVLPLLTLVPHAALIWPHGYVRVGPVVLPVDTNFQLHLSLAVAAALLPMGVIEFINSRYIRAFKRDLPVFFKAFGEELRTGETFEKGLETTTMLLGPALGDELRKVLTRVRLGESIEQAFRRMIDEAVDLMVARTATILITAYESGGNVTDVLDVSAEVFSLLNEYEDSKRVQIAPYRWTIYASLLIFIIVALILVYILFKPLFSLAATVPASFIRLPMSFQAFRALLFFAAFIQGFIGGFISGKMEEGTVRAGFKHAVIMLLVTGLSFYLGDLFLGGFQVLPSG